MRAAAILVCLWGLPAAAASPEWLRAAGRTAAAQYPPEVDAVVLLSEQNTSVRNDGEVKTVFRMAYKILRPDGRRFGTVRVHFDEETRLTFLKGWSIAADGAEYEAKEQDAVESNLSSETLYQSARVKVLAIPGAKVGSIVGYEYEQKRRPWITQDIWDFQENIPVRLARYSLELPAGWEFDRCWSNFAAREPREEGERRWVWEIENLPAIEHEDFMPVWRAVAGRLGIHYYAPAVVKTAISRASWAEVGAWFSRLSEGRRQTTPDISAKVKELTAGAETAEAKIEALATFVQRQVRYVAIETGIGGYQPHAAGDVFANRYGDCKDKATLLAVMLREAGVDSSYVLVNTDRGVLNPAFPSIMAFDHVILAIRAPVQAGSLRASSDHPKFGPLLFFDPTDRAVPFGWLPGNLQENKGLLVINGGGELVDLPVTTPGLNRLLRTTKMNLNAQGDATAEVDDLMAGSHSEMRLNLAAADSRKRMEMTEHLLADSVRAFRIPRIGFENIDKPTLPLRRVYSFTAPGYGQVSGDLMVLRPRIVGRKAYEELLTSKERKQPVEFESTMVDTDTVEITLPSGYVLDEAPAGKDLKCPFGRYSSSVEVKGQTLVYKRYLEISQLRIPLDQVQDLKRFFREIAADERAVVVLKRTNQ